MLSHIITEQACCDCLLGLAGHTHTGAGCLAGDGLIVNRVAIFGQRGPI